MQVSNLKNNFINWTNGNDKIDNFIQVKQLKIDWPWSIVFEWIPYNKFNEIKEINMNSLITVYSAIWNGPLCFKENKWIRKSNEKVALKCFNNTQNSINGILSKVWLFCNLLNLILMLL